MEFRQRSDPLRIVLVGDGVAAVVGRFAVVVAISLALPMNAINDIPEIQALDRHQHLVRIPPELDIPLTPRVKQILDSAEFRRLAQISQLGLVSLVYPAANH